MTQALYAHMNNKTILKNEKKKRTLAKDIFLANDEATVQMQTL
jgi:hypothetical protein